jgi:hypothetical protein
MIFKRAVAKLRAQDWTAITVELLIVIVGVFIGTWVANWNQDRLDRRETGQMLRNLRPELGNNIFAFGTLRDYYRVTRHYADTAFAGWRGDPGVSDKQFVIAAYQASQNTFTGINGNSWTQVFGGDRLRDIQDTKLREDLSYLMTTDYASMEREIFSDYRQHVRQVIPIDIQDAVRAHCGDQRFGGAGYIRLPPTCNIDLPDQHFKAGAEALRSHPELVGELRWHFAAVATYISNIDNLDEITHRLLKEIDQN